MRNDPFPHSGVGRAGFAVYPAQLGRAAIPEVVFSGHCPGRAEPAADLVSVSGGAEVGVRSG